MKRLKFNEANARDEEGYPVALSTLRMQDGGKANVVVKKYLLSKDELRYLSKNKTLYLVQQLGEKNPGLHLVDPFGGKSPFEPFGQNQFITHKLDWENHEFIILLSRDYNNNKAKVRWFSITMDSDWVKSGNLPDSLQSKGSGWLRRVMSEMIKELGAQR